MKTKMFLMHFLSFVFVLFFTGLAWAQSAGNSNSNYFDQIERELQSFQELNTKVMDTYKNAKIQDIRDIAPVLEEMAEQYKTLRKQIGYNEPPSNDNNLKEFQENLLGSIQNNTNAVSNYVNNLRQNSRDESVSVAYLIDGHTAMNKAITSLKCRPSNKLIVKKQDGCYIALTIQNQTIRELEIALKKYRHTKLKEINFKPTEDCIIDNVTHQFHLDSPVQDDGYLQNKGLKYEETLVQQVHEKLKNIAIKIVGSIGLRLEMEGLIDKQLMEERFVKDPPGYLQGLVRQISATKTLEATDRVRLQKALHEALKQVEALEYEIKMLGKLRSGP